MAKGLKFKLGAGGVACKRPLALLPKPNFLFLINLDTPIHPQPRLCATYPDPPPYVPLSTNLAPACHLPPPDPLPKNLVAAV